MLGGDQNVTLHSPRNTNVHSNQWSLIVHGPPWSMVHSTLFTHHSGWRSTPINGPLYSNTVHDLLQFTLAHGSLLSMVHSGSWSPLDHGRLQSTNMHDPVHTPFQPRVHSTSWPSWVHSPLQSTFNSSPLQSKIHSDSWSTVTYDPVYVPFHSFHRIVYRWRGQVNWDSAEGNLHVLFLLFKIWTEIELKKVIIQYSELKVNYVVIECSHKHQMDLNK